MSLYYDKVMATIPGLTYDDRKEFEVWMKESYSPVTIDMYNSHTCETNRYDAGVLLDEIFDNKLIMIENGVMFRDIKCLAELPPSVEVEEWFGYERKKKKDLQKHYDDVTKGNDPVKMLYYKYG